MPCDMLYGKLASRDVSLFVSLPYLKERELSVSNSLTDIAIGRSKIGAACFFQMKRGLRVAVIAKHT